MPEHKRCCHACRKEAGRTNGGGAPGNFCPHCGEPVSFRPPLRPGAVVGGHFRVEGAIAHGGLGWLYLAWDAELKIWVVLKGLMNPDEPEGRQAATAELEALAAARHRNIVRVYRKVEHPLRRPRRDGSVEVVDLDYIVMDYVPGRSLKELLESGGPMPVSLVLRYVLKILDALQHLHERRLLYCDLSPDQAIHTDSDPGDVQLIDLGAVRRFDSDDPRVWGKSWYQDPAIARTGPSVVTDLYTVARTAMRLSVPMPRSSELPHGRLPTPAEAPVLAGHDSYCRLLRRMLDGDHARRFPSAAEAATQAEGVLREEIAHEEGQPCPASSTLFGPEIGIVGADPGTFPAAGADAAAAALALPDLQIDPTDPNAGLIAALAALNPGALRRELMDLPDQSPESRLRAASAGIRLGGPDRAAGVSELEKLSSELPRDPRPRYVRGVAALADDDPVTATAQFSAVLDVWPGELTPKLAIAACTERRRPGDAAGHYEAVWRTDRSYVGAAFGLARCRLAAGDRSGAAAVLESIPHNSRHALTGRLCAILARVRHLGAGEPPADGFFAAAGQLAPERAELADLDEKQRHRTTAEVLEQTLRWSWGGRPWPATHAEPIPAMLLGFPLTEQHLRNGLERACRALADLDPAGRVEHIDNANRWRNRSWL